MRVALFVTCLVDTVFPQVGQATVTLLERLGHQVVFPRQQTCCGQPQLNTGYRQHALRLVRQHTDTFEPHDAVVVPAGSCAAAIRHQHAELAGSLGDRRLAERATRLAERTFDLAEFLTDVLGVADVGAYFPHRVTFHPTCHSLRLLRSADKALRLLRNVRGIDLVELGNAEECCGFGGTFAVKNTDVSTAMLADKARQVLATGAEQLTAADSSCLAHIGGGLERLRTGVGTVHLAQILAATEGTAP